MAAIEQQPLASTYSVEVSGWDRSHVFFVERSELTWSEDTGKLLTFSRRLPAGAMIFVRLLQPADGDRVFPVAYETEALSDASERAQLFRITRVVPAASPWKTARQKRQRIVIHPGPPWFCVRPLKFVPLRRLQRATT